MERNNRPDFSQRQPFLFGLAMLVAAVVIMMMAAAAFRHLFITSSTPSGARYGLVQVDGAIMDPAPVVEFLHTLRTNEDVLGVVVRVNSPGGVVGPSQEIHDAVRKTAQVKPVVVSMGAVAASGGYYVACPADEIFANPGTLTGSIGVIITLSTWKELLSDIGVSISAVTSGDLKDAGSPYKELSPKERAYFQQLVNDMNEQFVEAVAEGRDMPLADVRALATGQVYTGRMALEKGLVDQLGGLEDAKDRLRELTGGGDLQYVTGPKEDASLLEILTGAAAALQRFQAQSAPGPRFEYRAP